MTKMTDHPIHDDKLANDLRELAALQRQTAATMQQLREKMIAEAAASPGVAMKSLKEAETQRKAAAQLLRAAQDAEDCADFWDGE